MTASEAPEVHGANTCQTPHSASWRVTGKVNVNDKKDVDISEKVSRTGGIDDVFDGKYYSFGSAIYEMGGIDFTGKIDFLYKADFLVIGSGVGYKDGVFHHFTMGISRILN